MANGSLDHDELEQRLERMLRQQGPLDARSLYTALGISQSSFSRLVKRTLDRGQPLLTMGRARARRYAWRRDVPGVDTPIPLVEIRPVGPPRRLATLHPIAPTPMIWMESHVDGLDHQVFDDLPWFLEDMRPAGYLGRQVPLLLPEAELPRDIHVWSADTALRYLTTWAWNAPGNLIVGDEAFRRFLDRSTPPRDGVLARDREARYPELAAAQLLLGEPGSSAAGQQPKFLVTRQDPGGELTPVLVKFSPPLDQPVGRRVADLLAAEQLAARTLADHGIPAARCQVLDAHGQRFLEVERFDREGHRHRHGVVTLHTLDAEFSGVAGSWSQCARALRDQRVLDNDTFESIVRVELFGAMIGNTDMHNGNLALRLEHLAPTGLAPIYDMNPAAYMPRAGHILEPALRDPAVTPDTADAWRWARRAALDLWQRVADDPRISPAFRALAAAHVERIDALGALEDQLPR